MSKAKGLAWTTAAIAVAAGFAVGLPGLARHVPWPVERWLGRLAGTPRQDSVCRSRATPESRAALARLVRRIYPLYPEDDALPISVDVVVGSTVNAYASLGGRIYVYEGLIQQARSPEELAGVLAHEIEHVRRRHIIQGMVVNLATVGGLRAMLPGSASGSAGAAQVLLSLTFSRDQEAQADAGGLERLRAAHVDAAGFANFFARAQADAQPPPILSNHPSNGSRLERAAAYTGYPVEPVLSGAQWERVRQYCR